MNEHHPHYQQPTEHERSPEPSTEQEHEQSHETEPALRPKVWIGSLADYNAGTLTGDWVDAAVDAEQLVAAAQGIVARSETPGAEEWAIFDHDDFAGWHPGESEDLTIVAAVARGIAKHGPEFAAWADLTDADPERLAEFTDAYLGAYDSAEAWAEQMLDDLGTREAIDRLAHEQVGDIARYVRVDSAAWAQDAWLSGDIAIVHRPEGGVWIFDGRA